MERELLAFAYAFEQWFAKYSDPDDDCGFMNGDSDKYKDEDGAEQLEALAKKASDLIQRTTNGAV